VSCRTGHFIFYNRAVPRPKPQPKSSKPEVAAFISSRQNPLLKEILSIRDERDSPLLFLEGPRLIQEAVNAHCLPEMLIVSEEFPQTSFLEPIEEKTQRVFRVPDNLFRIISDVESPQGLLAIARRPHWTWEQIAARKPAPLVVLDGLQDPGNAAAIIRTAEASGAAGIVSTPGTAHLFSPKALRGAMGSSLRLPILEHLPAEEIAAKAKQWGYHLVAATVPQKSGKSVVYTKVDWKQPQALVLGQEGKGVSAIWVKLADQTIYLPMQPPVQSLNVGAAAAVLLYESARQRGN